MTQSTNKFEQLLELLINEENDKAQALFHEIVVEKSRDIYEGLADAETTVEAKEENKDEKKEEVKETEKTEAKAEETVKETEKTDSKDESVDEEVLSALRLQILDLDMSSHHLLKLRIIVIRDMVLRQEQF